MIEINKIYCENNLETMARMPDNFLDLTVTSPPYDDMDENFNPIPKNGMRDYNGYSWDFKAIAQELFRVTKQGGVVVWVVNDPTIDGSESLASSLQKIYFRRIGFNINTIIYDKQASGGARGNNDFYYHGFEYMLILSCGEFKTLNFLNDKINTTFGYKKKNMTGNRLKNGKINNNRKVVIGKFGRRTNIWKIENGFLKSSLDRIAFNHPAIFPEQLARDHIYSWSNEGDLVYDPFIGSGTTAKACIKMNRRWIGSEISQEYVDLANKRLDPYLRQTMLEI